MSNLGHFNVATQCQNLVLLDDNRDHCETTAVKTSHDRMGTEQVCHVSAGSDVVQTFLQRARSEQFDHDTKLLSF